MLKSSQAIRCILFLTIAAFLVSTTSSATHLRAAEPAFRYGEALQKSFFFYEAQQSGKLPDWNRVSWRGDSTLFDGKSDDVDLSGGWYDAGDHVKFGFPMAAAVTTLAWGAVENRDAYEDSDQLVHLLNNLRWANDYFINAHPEPNVLYGQVGDGPSDHAFWGAAEVVTAKGLPRPVYKITEACPGTDLAAETAAAMAASSMVFRPTDPDYADELLTHAEQLYVFADTTKGVNGQDTSYVNCITAARNFYNATGEGGQNPGATKMYWDELAWSSIWLYRATENDTYLERAREFYPKMGKQPVPGQGGSGATEVPAYSFGFGWNDKQYAVYALMAKLTGEQQFEEDTQRYLDYWTVGYNGTQGTTTPGGLAFIFYWASLRMAANTAWVAFVYADYLGEDHPLYERYHIFAKRQIDYALGDNPGDHSYMVGFGKNPPLNVHHRTAHGSWTNSSADGPPTNSRHVLYGALAGGPDESDNWADDRGDFVKNEVALDFNSGITSSLARLYKEYGGEPLTDFPPIEEPDGDEIYLTARASAGSSSTNLQLMIYNKSAWPARVLDKGIFRYYFTLEPGVTPDMIQVDSFYNQCTEPTGPTKLTGNTYFITIDCANTEVYPGGQSEFKKEIQLRLTSAGDWDASNDWSYQGLEDSGSTAIKAPNIPLYDDGKLIWGNIPDGAPTPMPTTPVPTTSTPTTTMTPMPTTPTATTPTATIEPTPTSVPGNSCQVAYEIRDQWNTGFVAEITITNTGSTINGWSLAWTFPAAQQVASSWNVTLTQDGANVTATDSGWNDTIPNNGTVSFGFQGTYDNTNDSPTTFSLNDTPCTVS